MAAVASIILTSGYRCILPPGEVLGAGSGGVWVFQERGLMGRMGLMGRIGPIGPIGG